MNEECSELCRKNPGLSGVAAEKLPDFTWDELADTLKLKAPTIYKIFLVTHSDHRKEYKKSNQHMPSICMAMATLLKERNREMCGVQSVIASQVQKKVSIYQNGGGKGAISTLITSMLVHCCQFFYPCMYVL